MPIQIRDLRLHRPQFVGIGAWRHLWSEAGVKFLSGAICPAQTGAASIETMSAARVLCGTELLLGLGQWKQWLQLSSGCHGAAGIM